MAEYSNEQMRMRARCEDAEQRDARLAAEAVVDAAVWKRRLRIDAFGPASPVSEATRQSLIQLILNDPSLTPYLFTDEAWERH